MSVVMVGTSYGWTSMVLDELLSSNSPIPMTLAESSWMVSIISFGELVSPVPTSMAADHWGRKWPLLATAPIYFLSWLVVLFTHSFWVLFGVRVVQGICMGVVCTIVPMYISEISSPHIRGKLSSIFSIMWYSGILYEYILGTVFGFKNLLYATLLLPVISFSMFLVIPESPYYLIMKQRDEDAQKSLRRLRSCSTDEELQGIKKSIQLEIQNKLSWVNLFTQSTEFKTLLIVLTVAIVKFMSGGSAINSFANQTFASTKAGLLTSSQFSICLGVIIVLATVFYGSLVDRVGRRPFFLMSTFGCAVSETLTALFYFVDQHFTDLSNYSYIPFLTISLYFVFFSVGLSPLVPIIQTELFSSQTRSMASGITVSVGTIAIFVNMKTYQIVNDRFGIYLNFFIFSIFCYIGVVFIYMFVPETKCKSFAEIQCEAKSQNNRNKIQPCSDIS